MLDKSDFLKVAAVAAMLPALAIDDGSAAACAMIDGRFVGHPCPQPRPGPSVQKLNAKGTVTKVETPTNAIFPPQNPFTEPPGSNFLGDTDYRNMRDGNNVEIPNSLPSRPGAPYNLHPDPEVTPLADATSPTDDLKAIMAAVRADPGDRAAVRFALDILEGNPIPNRPQYSGFPLLHYRGHEKVQKVACTGDGDLPPRTIRVRQILYDTHYEADTAIVDLSELLEGNRPNCNPDSTWTILYTIDVLNRGHEDFAPFAMFVDDDGAAHFGMDQSFFPLEDGTRSVFRIEMPPARYYKLTYHWGWRIHPPRVQVLENAKTKMGGVKIPEQDLVQWEESVFGNGKTKNEAIAMIGDRAPAKRMWTAFKRVLRGGDVARQLAKAEAAFFDWQDRNRLPDGIPLDEDSDLTLFYANNTIYGQLTDLQDRSEVRLFDWETRGTKVKIKLYNGDYFEHAYINVDFGGRRGWENSFHDTIAIGGAGPWFSFGRAHWWVNAGRPSDPGGLIVVPCAQPPSGAPTCPAGLAAGNGPDGLGAHDVHITYNFEPSRRLRFYQFDPLHHDVAVWSVH